jgi:hypothetical protein
MYFRLCGIDVCVFFLVMMIILGNVVYMSVGVFDWGDVCGAVDNFGI